METVESGSVMIVMETRTISARVIKKINPDKIEVLIFSRHIDHIQNTLGIQVGISHQQGRSFIIELDPISFCQVKEGDIISFKLKTTVPFKQEYPLIVIIVIL